MVIFLRYNGLHFKMDPQKAEDLTVELVNNKYTLSQLAEIIKEHCIDVT